MQDFIKALEQARAVNKGTAFYDGLTYAKNIADSILKHCKYYEPAPPPDARTLRDDFAIAALQGILANEGVISPRTDVGINIDNDIKDMTRDAYKVADAMLKARQS